MEIPSVGGFVSDKFLRAKNSPDLQAIGSSNRSNLEMLESNRARDIIGDLLYKLTGLLAIQSLYTLVVQENSGLKAQVQRLQSPSSLDSLATENAKTASFNKLCAYDESEDKNGYSLLSDMCRRLQMKITRLEMMIHEIEGTSAKGLIQQNHDLEQACKHYQAVVEDLERELMIYKRHWESSSVVVESESSAGLVAGVNELLQTEKLLSLERTVVVEVSKQLQEKVHEVAVLRQQLDFERYGHRQSEGHLNGILTDFVRCCLDIPYVGKDAELTAAFQELLNKSEILAPAMRDHLTAAVEVAVEDGSRLDFFRELALEEVRMPENMEEARSIINELLEKLRRLGAGAKRNIIEQMRKFKHAAIKVKDLEEKLKKSDVDRQLVEQQLGDEIGKQRTKYEQLEQSLGIRSSYATKASQSVRSLVELLDSQKAELERQNKALETDMETCKQQLNSLLHRNTELETEMESLRTAAVQEPTVAVQADLEALRSNYETLQQEALTAQKRCEIQDEHLKRVAESRKSLEEQIEHLQSQVTMCEAEIREHKDKTVSLVESNRQLSAQVADLETELKSLRSNHHTLPLQQLEASGQRVSGSVRYIGRDVPRPQLVSQTLSSFPHVTASVSQHRRTSVRQQMSVTTQSPLLSTSAATQSPVPTVPAGHGQSSRRDSLGLSGASSYWSMGGGSPISRQRFSSLSQVSGDSPNGIQRTGSDSGRPHSTLDAGHRHSLYSRSVSSRDTMQCLRCGSRYSVADLDGYEKHIRDCYSNVQ